MAVHSDGASRVLELYKQLEQDVAKLQKEKEELLAERCRWMPIQTPRGVSEKLGNSGMSATATAILASAAPPKLPSKCAMGLADAANHDRRGAEAQRRASKSQREADRLRQQRADVEQSCRDTVAVAESRRTVAEQRLAKVKADRKQAEVDYHQEQAHADAQTNKDLQSIEAEIERERESTEEACHALRHQARDEIARAKRETAEAQAALQRKQEELELSLQKFSNECATKMSNCQRRIKDAEGATQDAWTGCRDKISAVHTTADGEVQSWDMSACQHAASTTNRLAGIETSMLEQLKASNAREQALLYDMSSEDNAKAVEQDMADAIRNRLAMRDEALTKNALERARVARAAEEAGKRAIERAKYAQEDADQDVEGLRIRVENYATTGHKGKLLALQQQLNEAVAASRAELARRLDQFSAEAERQLQEARSAMTQADQKVDALRSTLASEVQGKAIDTEAHLQDAQIQRQKLEEDSRTKVQQTQAQMIEYVTSMEAEACDTLRAPDAEASLPLKLPLMNCFSPSPEPTIVPDQVLPDGSKVFQGEFAVLVSDLSGFTSTTRKYGITHFASIIVRKRQLAYPILAKYEAVHLTTEADNLIVVFRCAKNAAKAAVEIQQVLLAYNRALDETRQHFAINLNGIAVHSGDGLILDRGGHPHGEAAHGAYHLGEEVCKNGVVMVSEAVKDKLDTDEYFSLAAFQRHGGPKSGTVSTVSLDNVKQLSMMSTGMDQYAYTITGLTLANESAYLLPCNDARFLVPGLLQLARRHDPQEDLEALDADIAAKCMVEYTVVMFSVVTEKAVTLDAELQVLQRKSTAVSVQEPSLLKYGGVGVESMLWLFKTPVDALLAVVEARRAVLDFNRAAAENDKITISGWGIHTGKLLFVDGSDVHWGDAVNTASKLGQDLAKTNDIYVMPVVKEVQAFRA
eukprot:TRINITY_DN24707_c0_g3_i3.p1 TRINITY_DN24707_c0_g3~~TRINITY_DN24707_c0_g3_i3.p1  ORF type:complete len:925 (+),score=254.40 TRINITY_DN24707_c0_g3_i3:78-2852(+)